MTCEVSDPAVIDVSRLAVALPAVSVTKVNVSRLAGRSPGYSVPAKIPGESFQASELRPGNETSVTARFLCAARAEPCLLP